MKWVKSKLFENIGKKIFLDEYGYCSINLQNVTIDDKSLDQIYVYSKQNRRFERMVFDSNALAESLRLIFNSDLATRKQPANGYYYGYGGSQSFTSAEAVDYKMKFIKVHLAINYWTSISGGNTQTEYEDIVLSSEGDIKKYICWRQEDGKTNRIFQPVDLSVIKDNDELYLVGTGKVKIKEVYQFPNSKNHIFKAEDTENNSLEITLDSELYYLPYDHRKDLLDEIDEANNELLLSPRLSNIKEMPGVYNIYWKPVLEASRYIVTVYKLIDTLRGVYYKLAEYDVDRNTYFLALDKLVGSGFVFKVCAEDRNGNIIAKSRGIKSSVPTYLNI